MFQKVLLTIGYGVKIGGKTDMRAGFPIGGEYVLYTVYRGWVWTVYSI